MMKYEENCSDDNSFKTFYRLKQHGVEQDGAGKKYKNVMNMGNSVIKFCK